MPAPSKIAVTGASGRVGQHVVDLLTAEGREVVPISRSNGVDVITGRGLAEALAGVACVVDTATGPSPDLKEAADFFATSGRNLQEAGERAGVQRMIEVSIIGTDRFTSGYAAAKLLQEQFMLAGPVPVRVLRAAQFHEFVGQLVDWGRQGDVSYVQEVRVQPVAAATVARALADLATDPESAPGPAGTPVLEIAGPREETLVDLAMLLMARRGDPVKIEASDAAGPGGAVFEENALLPSSHASLAGPTFEAWLDAGEQVP
jgi:uncharacterized protein YbjT (DUF2867 family)